jgi:asparagine synthase (glutamine-hydrolysing)
MPGIVGLITRKPREEAIHELRQMTHALCYEQFYSVGSLFEESLGLYVGWSARKGSFSDAMPLCNEKGDHVLIFSGEDFPEHGTAESLRASGHQFEPEGPAYLVHQFEEEQDFPRRLNGRFHGLAINLANGTCSLFNDRFGMHRLYYHESKDGFYFAAEAKAILAVRPELRQLNPRSLGEYISCGAVLEDRTLFRGIALLPPGSSWSIRNSTIERKSTYFHPKEWEDLEPLDTHSFDRELTEVFSRNLPRYFGAAQPVAMSLTGGLDTRMIMAWQKAAPGALPCYTFGSNMRENQDVRVARRVAAACQQPFQVLAAGQEFLSNFARYAERAIYLSDGCADLSRSPDVYLNEKARQIAPIRMTGNYGGEILRQVRTFKPAEPLPGLFDSALLPDISRAAATFSHVQHGNPVSFAAFKQNPWNHYGILALEESQLSLRTPFLDNDLVRTAIRAPLAALRGNGASLHLMAQGNRELLRIPTDRGLSLTGGSNGARRAFLEFQFKAEYAYDMGMPQWVAKIDHAFARLRLERLFLGRHKVFHFRVWYRDALASYVKEILLDPLSLSRPYLGKNRVQEMVTGHLRGDRNYTNELHKVLSLELIHRLLLDPSKGASRVGTPAPVEAARAY